MAKYYDELNEKLIEFINRQKIFFVGTYSADKGVNVSPKGVYPVKVLDKKRVAFLGLRGSGNRTAEDIASGSDVTMMFCSFDEKPLILRLYCRAEALQKGDPEFDELSKMWDGDTAGNGKKPSERARDVFVLHIRKAHTSCGYGVPNFSYAGEKPDAGRL